jgi:predicted hydrocarbon binding protein
MLKSMPTETDRTLSTRRTKIILLAMQEVLERNGLTAMLKRAGLQRYIGELSPADAEFDALRASEYAVLLQSIEAQYGSGARGQLNRIGHECFKQMLALEGWNWNMLSLTNRLLPTRERIKRSLTLLAQSMAEPDGDIKVSSDGEQLIFTDSTSDGTRGRTSATEICWLTVGELQECVYWATEENYEVSEVDCKAKGDPACVFVIGARL